MNKELYENAFNEESFEGGYIPTSYYLFDETVSTNEEIIERARQGAPEGTLAVALKQTNGQGRSGRTFFSPNAGNLYMSFLLRPSSTVKLELLTPAAAVATNRAISRVLGIKTQIKWVNDLYYGDKKVCGIIAKANDVGDVNKMNVVIGIGINVHIPCEAIPEDIPNYGTLLDSVYVEGEEDIIPKLCAAVYSEYMKIYTDLDDLDFMNDYRNSSNVIGQEVTYVVGETEQNVMVKDIDNEGRLIVVDDKGQERIFRDGEIRIKI